MHCQTCGSFNSEALNYCKHCGTSFVAAIAVPDSKPPSRRPAGAAWLIALALTLTAGVCLGGLSLVIILMLELRRNGFPVSAAASLGALSLLMLLGSIIVIGRQVSRLIGVCQQTSLPAPASNRVLDASLPPASIGTFRAPATSVTEHTTRTLGANLSETRASS